jgi:lysozyme
LQSFVYNLGSGRLQSSTLRRKINRGDFEGAADEFPKWRRAGGKILKGLVLRRAAERKLFLS